ncbi:MAG TPA: FAD-binding protein [Thermoplasmata archaeon]|nr:FAD-binding protein [Thermoplasmata archaeon]
MDIDIEKLRAIVGDENVSDRIVDLYVYSSDASVHQSMPSMVLRPGSTEEVQRIMRYANEHRIPVVPRGAGSGMGGHAVPVDGGIVLDMKRMDRILDIRPEDMLCRVETGVVNDDLNRALRPHGVFFPPTPSSGNICTIGGMIGTNASGNRAVKYGATRDAVLGLKVVLANGDAVELGTSTRVESSGYQLHRLIVGSEGTLAVVTEATLLLAPLPTHRSIGVVNFDTLEDAGRAISAIVAGGLRPSMMELMDDVAITAVNRALGLGLPDVAAIVMFECNGMSSEEVDREMRRAAEIFREHGGHGIETSDDPEEMARIYAGRKNLFPSLSRYREGLVSTSLADDLAVPISRIAETVEKVHEVAERHGVVMSAYGHCGSGLIHTKVLMDPTRAEQWVAAKRAVDELYAFVRSVGGTTSGEHGIGLSKAPMWKLEKADHLELMRAVKRALDPNGILNPHKLMDAPDDWTTATPLRYRVRG